MLPGHASGLRGRYVHLRTRNLCHALTRLLSFSLQSQPCLQLHTSCPYRSCSVISSSCDADELFDKVSHAGCCRAGKRNVNMPGTPPSHGLMYCWHGKSGSGLRCFSYLIPSDCGHWGRVAIRHMAASSRATSNLHCRVSLQSCTALVQSCTGSVAGYRRWASHLMSLLPLSGSAGAHLPGRGSAHPFD